MSDNGNTPHGVKLHSFTFEDSGVTIQYRKLSPNTILEFNKWFEAHHVEPKPPMQKVTYANGHEGEEANESHPDYIRDRKEYNIKKQVAMQRLLIKRAIVLELDVEQKEAVKEFREFWREEYGEEIKGEDDKPLNDREVYLWHVACSTPEELKELSRAVSRRSFVTEEAVSEASKSV